MNTSLVIEEDRGTYTRGRHPHNGYYGGDFASFSGRPTDTSAATSVGRTARQASAQGLV